MKNPSTPPTIDIAIVAANYNNGPYIRAFMDSILGSTVWPAELIVVDDGSTDNSVNILREYTNLPFFQLMQLPVNRGFTHALNEGIQRSSARYIVRADPDDLLLPERLEVQYRLMEDHPELDVAGSNSWYFHSDTGAYINRSNFPLTHREIVHRYRNGEHGLQHGTVIGKASVFKRYPYQEIFPGEDYEIFSRMVADGCVFMNLAEALYLVRVHPASSTSTLRYASIQQTFAFREKIFGTPTSSFRVRIYYWHIYCYRRAQMAGNPLARFAYLGLATLLAPQKIFRRFSGTPKDHPRAFRQHINVN